MLGTFIKNTNPIIENILGDSIVKIASTFVIFEGDIEKEYPFLNSTFILWKSFDKSFLGAEKVVNWILHSPKSLTELNIIKSALKFESLRFIYLKNNQTIQFPDELLNKINKRFSNVVFRKTNSDRDIILGIDDDSESAWLGIKISNNPDYHVEERKGFLRPQLAYILNYISKPTKGDIFLDPFAGSGEIPKSAFNNFKYEKFIAIDNDPKILNIRGSDKIHVITDDFFEVNIAENSIDKIVTDPPWGNYDKTLDIVNFYNRFFEKINRIVKTNGVIVLLISRDIMDVILGYIENKFNLTEQYEIKVWGRPAVILRLLKK